jgi:hypothetical protein
MTGQVKEEILTRFGELGVRVHAGAVSFQPKLLRRCEFLTTPQQLRYLDIAGNWQLLTVPGDALGFTWCQVPVIYQLDDNADSSLTITFDDGTRQTLAQLELPVRECRELFERSGHIRQLTLSMSTANLFNESI